MRFLSLWEESERVRKKRFPISSKLSTYPQFSVRFESGVVKLCYKLFRVSMILILLKKSVVKIGIIFLIGGFVWFHRPSGKKSTRID